MTNDLKWLQKPTTPGWWLEIWTKHKPERGTDLREHVGCVEVTQNMLDDPDHRWLGDCVYCGPVPAIPKTKARPK